MAVDSLVNAAVEQAMADTAASAALFRPELVLCGTIVTILLLRVFQATRRIGPYYVALVGLGAGLWCAVPDGALDLTAEVTRREIFSGLLVYDWMTVFFRSLLLAFALLFCLLTRLSGVPEREDGADFYPLILGATLGFCLMASANHLLMVFLAVEMASVPSYVLAGLLKGRRQSSEAALKYSVYGAGAAGIMLYGISLLCGVLGSPHLPTLAHELVTRPVDGPTTMVLALAGLMIMAGLAFKLSAVPFHFWCPDVFEGATAEIDAFLSIASKAAALALLVRLSIGLAVVPGTPVPTAAEPPPTVVAAPATRLVAVRTEQAETDPGRPAEAASAGAAAPLRGETIRHFLVMLLTFLAAITCTFGNLAAYGQTNIKRLLAYSTIAHAGYMIMPVAAALALAGSQPALAREAITALAFYISVYLFMNLSAFAIVAFLRNATESETIDDYAGLIRTHPVIVVCFSVTLVSLIGMPPFGGFVGKFFIFAALVKAGGPVLITLLVIAGLNTAISLVYYLRVVKVMTMDPEPDSRRPVVMGFMPAAYAVAVTLPVFVFGIYFNGLYEWAEMAASELF